MISIDEQLAEAQVYKDYPDKNGGITYIVKVSLLDAGLYITGITAQRSPKYPDKGWWVQLPRTQAAGRYFKPFEMDLSSELWTLIERRTIEAVELYITQNEPAQDDPFNLDDIHFPS